MLQQTQRALQKSKIVQSYFYFILLLCRIWYGRWTMIKSTEHHHNTNFGGFVRVYEYDDEIEVTFAYKKFKLVYCIYRS